MHFTKMQGLGNDYLYIFGEVPEDIAMLSRRLSDRRFGAGSDGMICISRSDIADFKMRVFNADGSEAKMCGNGIRCVGKYVYEKGYTEKTVLTVETLSGIKTLKLDIEDSAVASVTVGMGKAEVSADREVCGVVCTPVSVGNPHAVVFCEDAEKTDIVALGAAMQGKFEDGVNAEFVTVIGKDRLRMRVYERGSGVTMACGTGACASAAAAVAKGLCESGKPIKVALDGGELEITVSDGYEITMRGGAEFVYEGETEIIFGRRN